MFVYARYFSNEQNTIKLENDGYLKIEVKNCRIEFIKNNSEFEGRTLFYRLKKRHWFSNLSNAKFKNIKTDLGNDIKFYNPLEDSRYC